MKFWGFWFFCENEEKMDVDEYWFWQSFSTVIDDFFALIWGSIYRERLGFKGVEIVGQEKGRIEKEVYDILWDFCWHMGSFFWHDEV
jgi:hypothetical protein